MIVLELVVQFIAEAMYGILTNSKCSNCGGELKWVKESGKRKGIKCPYCKREWVKDSQSNWQELNFKQQ